MTENIKNDWLSIEPMRKGYRIIRDGQNIYFKLMVRHEQDNRWTDLDRTRIPIGLAEKILKPEFLGQDPEQKTLQGEDNG